ncbi:hypothetical protein [Methylocapsa aurea]|uniref:hypothetical protein n=1 Tax=Methylocapsa aurea TaxID=663610 RepID=UPI0012EC33FB|nr:hypothetical protein [Methylocapsa aurea]
MSILKREEKRRRRGGARRVNHARFTELLAFLGSGKAFSLNFAAMADAQSRPFPGIGQWRAGFETLEERVLPQPTPRRLDSGKP